jgi:hypothetical protein
MNESILNSMQRFHRSPEMVHSSIDGEVVMMSVDKGEYYGLNAMGSRIWELLEKPHSVEELCRELMMSFEVDQDTCLAEVSHFLGEIADQKLVAITK